MLAETPTSSPPLLSSSKVFSVILGSGITLTFLLAAAAATAATFVLRRRRRRRRRRRGRTSKSSDCDDGRRQVLQGASQERNCEYATSSEVLLVSVLVPLLLPLFSFKCLLNLSFFLDVMAPVTTEAPFTRSQSRPRVAYMVSAQVHVGEGQDGFLEGSGEDYLMETGGSRTRPDTMQVSVSSDLSSRPFPASSCTTRANYSFCHSGRGQIGQVVTCYFATLQCVSAINALFVCSSSRSIFAASDSLLTSAKAS